MTVAIDGSGTDKGFKGDLKASDGTTLKSKFEVSRGSSATCSATVNKSGISSIYFATSNTYSKTRTATISNIKVTYQYAASLSADDVSMDDTPKGGSSTKTITVTYQNSTNSATISAAEQSDTNGFFSISPSSHNVTDCSGSVDFTVTFAPTAPVDGASATYRFSGNGTTKDVTVTGTAFNVVDPTFTNTFESFYYVDAPALNLAELWTSNNSNGNIEYSVTKFDVTGKNNEAGVDPYIDGNTLYLGKAGEVTVKMHQDASTGYNSKDATLKITIKKRPNTLSCNWESWEKTLNFNEGIYTIFSSDNELIDLSPINVLQTSGDKNATYYPAPTNYIFASVNDNTDATWEVSQDENYKYEAAVTKTFSVHVSKASAPEDCKIILYTGYSDKSAKVSDIPEIDLKGEGEKLSLHITTNGYFGNDAKLYTHTATTDWNYLRDVSAPEGGETDLKDIDLPEGTTHIKFEKKGTDNPYIMSIVVTKPRYFNIQDAGNANISSLNMPQNTPGGKVKTAKFYVDYSTCDDTIRLMSTNSQITFTASGTTTHKFAVDAKHYGRQEIELTYTSGTTAEVISSVVTAYTRYDNAAITVNAETVGKLATHINYIGNASYPADTTNIAAANLFEVRDVNEALVPGATVTLGTKNASIADVVSNAVDPICSGDVTITASYAGDDTYEDSDKEQSINIHRVVDFVTISGRSVIVEEDDIDLSTWCSSQSGTALSYRVLHSSVLAIENGHLIAKAKGKDTLVVTSAGDCVYSPGVDSLFIKVRKATDPCESTILEETATLKLGAYYGYSKSKPKTLDLTYPDRPKDSLFYSVWKYSNITTQDIHFEIYDNKDSLLWDTIHYSGALGTSARVEKMSMANLQAASYLKVYANSDGFIGFGGTLYKYVSNIKITQQCYFTVENLTPATMPTVTACETAEAQFDLKYSDVGPIYLTHDAGDQLTYEVWKDGVKLNDFDNDCGNWGVYTIKLFYVPLTAGDYSHTVTLSASGKTQTVTISGTATAAKREIIWDVPTKNTITATQSANILTAFAQTDCVNPAGEVTYTISPASAVTVSGTTVTFNQPIDKVTITANTTSSELYGAADAVTKEWQVNQIGVTMQTLPTITSDIYCGNSASDVTYAEDWLAVNTLNGGEVAGSISYDSPATFSAAEPTNLTFTFIPDDDLYETIQFNVSVNVAEAPVLPTEYVFTGEGSWETESGWNTNSVPEQNVDIKVTGQLVIDKDCEVKSLTIEGSGSVTTVENGKLTVNADSKAADTYGDLYVKEGGEVVLNGTLQVRDFIIASTTGSTDGSSASGKVENISDLNINGDAYIDITFAPMSLIDDVQWYGFALPFEVDALNGVYRFEGSEVKKVTNMVNYAIAQYSAAAHYAGKTAWSYNKGTLRAGEFYMFTTDGVSNTYRFKKNKSAAKQGTTSLTLKTCGEGSKGNWNALGNATLTYVNASFSGGEFVQVYKNGYSSYMAVSTKDVSFVVGCPFFVQATKEEPLTLEPVSVTRSLYYAPRRTTTMDASDKYKVQIAADGESFSDQIFVSATEDAANEYEIGRDVRKAGTGTKCAQLWVNAYNEKLCVNEAVLTENQATFDLTLYAPKSGEYTISLADASDKGTLYLTQNGIVIWNLSNGAYVAELTKGNNTEYGLLLAAKSPQVTTDIEAVDANKANVQKLIVNGQLFVLKDGVMYNATGKKVK